MAMNGEMFLVVLMFIGLIGNSHIITTAASVLLLLKLVSLDRFFSAVERRGLELGLLFLTIAVLTPFAKNEIHLQDIFSLFQHVYGVLALLGGAIATYLNRKGLELLQQHPELIIGIVFGSIGGIIFLNGVPVGPLMAAGIAFLLVGSMRLVQK